MLWDINTSYCNIRPVRQEFLVVRAQLTTTGSLFNKSIQSVFNDTIRASVKYQRVKVKVKVRSIADSSLLLVE